MITIEEVMEAIQPSKKLDLRFLYDMDESLKMDEAAIQNVKTIHCFYQISNKAAFKIK